MPTASTAGRIRVLLVVIAVLFSIAAVRALQLQVIDASSQAAQAAKNIRASRDLPALRGEIRDRDGKVMAFTTEAVDVIAHPNEIANNGKSPTGPITDTDRATGQQLPTIVAAIISRTLPADTLINPDVAQRLSDPNTKYVRIARQVPIGTYQKLQTALNAVDKKQFPLGLGWTVEKEPDPKRVYPMGTVASNVLGYLADNKGATGLEAGFDTELTGHPGREIYDSSKNGRIPLGNSTLTPATNGDALTTTLDSTLCWTSQQLIDSRRDSLKADWGFALIMDVKTGQMLCLANTPTFDGNAVSKAPLSALNNPAMSYPYEPGSTMKLLSLAAIIDASADTPHPVTPDTITHVDATRDGIKSAENTIHDSETHDAIDFTTRGILATSSNQGVITLARQVFSASGKPGKQHYLDYLQAFRLGQKTNLGLPAENAGTLPVAKLVGDSYTLDSVAFGTSLTVNAAQLAAAVNSIANDGVYQPASLILSTTSPTGEQHPTPAQAPQRILKSSTSKQVLAMMENRVLYSYDILGIPGYRTGAKTGSARMGSGDLLVSIAGVAPIDDPQILVYTSFYQKNNREGGGITAAGPVYRDIMTTALQRRGILPDPTAQQHCTLKSLASGQADKPACTKK